MSLKEELVFYQCKVFKACLSAPTSLHQRKLRHLYLLVVFECLKYLKVINIAQASCGVQGSGFTPAKPTFPILKHLPLCCLVNAGCGGDLQ